MENRPVPENNHGLAAVQPGKEILSIQFRLGGLSYAYLNGEGNTITASPALGGEVPAEALRSLLFSSEWPENEFDGISVCVPTRFAVLIPAEESQSGSYESYFRIMGFEITPNTRFFSQPAGRGKILLYAACETLIEPLREKFGEKLSFFHPLTVNLTQERQAETLLLIDNAGGCANITLSSGANLLFADVFPVTDEASLLVAVNRIIVSNKIGSFRIVCSGENCRSAATALSRHYRHVSLHPDAENRNLIFPLR